MNIYLLPLIAIIVFCCVGYMYLHKPSISYSREIFGSMLEVKKLLVTAIQIERQANNLSVEQMETTFGVRKQYGFSYEELEESPVLLTFELFELIANSSIDRPDGLTIDPHRALEGGLLAYLNNPQTLDEVLAKYHSGTQFVHVTNYGSSPDAYLEELAGSLADKAMGVESNYSPPCNSPNTISRETWAMIHLVNCILKEMGNEKSRR